MFDVKKNEAGEIVRITTYTCLNPTAQDLFDAIKKNFPNRDLSKIHIRGIPSVVASVE
jgi:hypothetical protein